jgi:L,D-transpeptidase ErfK/SrfK
MRVQLPVVLALIVAGTTAPTGRSVRAQEPARRVGAVVERETRRGETLRSIAARSGIEPATLAADNGIRVDVVLAVGQRLIVDNRHLVPPPNGARLVVNVPQRMVFHHAEDGTLHAYPAAVGRADWPTPRGAFTVIARETNPTWDVPASILEESRRNGRVQAPRVPPGPNNPLGAHWIGLSLPGVGIHGTNAPSSIFRAVSHGCIRLHPDDVADLFGRVTVGDGGRSIYEPVLLGDAGGRIYLEVHRDVYRRLKQPLLPIVQALAAAAGLEARIDWNAAAAVIAARHGVARDVTLR